MNSSKGKTAVTALDVARSVGVSRSTVSMVLRGQAEKRKISPETAERVLAAAKKLKYVPNQLAVNLRRRKSGMIGVVLINFRWDWAQLIVQGMTGAFYSRDYTPFVAIHEFDQDRARRELLSCISRRDEGVITQPLPGLDDVYKRIKQHGIPLVFLGDYPKHQSDASYVAWDSTSDARLAIRHLIETGRKRIGFFGFDYPMPFNEARYDTYLQTLEDAGLPRHEHWVARPPISWALREHATDWAIQRMFDSAGEKPDAIFVLNDGLAVPLLHLLEVRGIRVPDDVAVIGMGDFPICSHAGIGLSTVKEPVEQMGQEAARIMMGLIDNPDVDPVQCVISCGELKERRTTVGIRRKES